MEEVDLAIIGAGQNGLTALKTYKQIHPHAEIAVFEASDSIGGTWSKKRLYPGLRTNNILGTYESPDFPMDGAKYGVKAGQHIPGPVVNQYLNDFAEKFDLLRYVRLNTSVDIIKEANNNTWLLSVSNNGITKQTHAQKLIFAHGLTDEPNMPYLEGKDSFSAPLYHGKEFAQHAYLVKTSKNVAVLGGAKSGFDAAYEYASNDVTVDWIIRESGRGPCWMVPTLVTPFKLYVEHMLVTRFLTWFTPCIWADNGSFGFFRRLLHQTIIGRWIVGLFWMALQNDANTQNKFDTDARVGVLKPWISAFWTGTTVSILNYPSDFFEHVRNGRIRVHMSDIDHLEAKSIILKNGTTLNVEALHCATGWKHAPRIKFEPESLVEKLGMPHKTKGDDPLTRAADMSVLARYPALRKQPNLCPKKNQLSQDLMDTNGEPDVSYRLYRFMIPLAFTEQRNVAFIGMALTIASMSQAQAQSLWVTAFFDGKLSVSQDARMETEICCRFEKWRHPAGFGNKHADLVFESIPYIDLLLNDLGVKHLRKANLFKELFESYEPSNYRNIVGEWMQSQNIEGKPTAARHRASFDAKAPIMIKANAVASRSASSLTPLVKAD